MTNSSGNYNLNILEQKICLLLSVIDVIDSTVNNCVLNVLPHNDGTKMVTVKLKNDNSVVAFLSMALEMNKQPGDSIVAGIGTNVTVLKLLRSLSNNCCLLNGNFDNFNKSIDDFQEWLDSEYCITKFYFPSFGKQITLVIKNSDILELCANSSKHCVVRHHIIRAKLKRILEHQLIGVELNDANLILAMEDFTEQFLGDNDYIYRQIVCLAYYLNNIRWSLFKLLEPTYIQSLKYDEHLYCQYKYITPQELNEVGVSLFYKLMNWVRTKPYMHKFEIMNCYKRNRTNMTILLTGGAGFIGSHTALELLKNEYDIIIVDDFRNSSPDSLVALEQLTGQSIKHYAYDVCDKAAMEQVFAENAIDCVIHFAGLKAVGESIQKPIEYYRNNLDSTLTLLECMQKYYVKNFIFSSSATVYGAENSAPCVETMPKGSCTNPYGWTKSMIEQILTDVSIADPEMSIVLLRYFNPIGAHESGLIGEMPNGIPNNLIPYIIQTAAGIREKLTIFGNDYSTKDGTCRRDFIHVMDLATGHRKAIEYVVKHKGVEVFNLGTGTPYSVLELVETFKKVNGVDVPYVIGPRRDGDLEAVWADASKAERLMGWKAEHSLEDMCRDSWRWQQNCCSKI